MTKPANQLIHETSPYLLQHAHNPVDWQAWNEKAWAQAVAEDKLVIISIGYSACHWCHVMEHESFEDSAVAALMNEHFISIKVDREERPDVDQIYMDAVQLISGHGGWPLNAIALPDGRPIYAGTYFPKEQWKQVLNYFTDYWKNKKEEAYQRAEEITHGIRQMDVIDTDRQRSPFNASVRNAIFKQTDAVWDYDKGGRSGAPKFPMPVNLQYLLRHHFYTDNDKALKAVTVTLDNMMNGGIYDQAGGGFARYSVDDAWVIPHFEKMLYDNAQLVSLYAEAYAVTKNECYKDVVYETLEFIERELSDEAGGFYSALDADSEGEEGKFYVWTYDELKQLLGSDFDAFSEVFDISKQGNFEGANNLVRKPNAAPDPARLKAWKKKILEARSHRVRPGLDDKVLTSWNALMLKGYIDAYQTFGEQRFLDRALRSAAFLQSTMLAADFSILRNYKGGRVTISGFLDDYSFTCEAFLALYQVTFDERWLVQAKGIADYVVQHFYNAATGMFFYTSVTDQPLIARKTETSDNVIPSSNSSMAKALYLLGNYYEKADYIAMAQKATLNMQEQVTSHPAFYANWAILADWLIDEPYEVAIMGEQCAALRRQFGDYFLPNSIFSGSRQESNLPLLQGKLTKAATTIYVCHHKTCQLPVHTVTDALKQME